MIVVVDRADADEVQPMTRTEGIQGKTILFEPKFAGHRLSYPAASEPPAERNESGMLVADGAWDEPPDGRLLNVEHGDDKVEARGDTVERQQV